MNGEEPEEEKEFKYLGSADLEVNAMEVEMNHRLSEGTRNMKGLGYVD